MSSNLSLRIKRRVHIDIDAVGHKCGGEGGKVREPRCPGLTLRLRTRQPRVRRLRRPQASVPGSVSRSSSRELHGDFLGSDVKLARIGSAEPASVGLIVGKNRSYALAGETTAFDLRVSDRSDGDRITATTDSWPVVAR